MSIIGIDIGSSTTKIIEYAENKIINKDIVTNKDVEQILEEFNNNNINIKQIEKIVVTGIGADKLKNNKYNIPIDVVEEFKAIAAGGLYLSDKKEALIVSIGTGTAFVRANKNEIKHIGGTGVGAGTLFNICKGMKKYVKGIYTGITEEEIKAMQKEESIYFDAMRIDLTCEEDIKKFLEREQINARLMRHFEIEIEGA